MDVNSPSIQWFHLRRYAFTINNSCFYEIRKVMISPITTRTRTIDTEQVMSGSSSINEFCPPGKLRYERLFTPLENKMDEYRPIHTDDTNINNVIDAIFFACKKHSKQKRKNSESSPYINHCVEVQWLLSRTDINDTDTLIAAVLHDVVEDTGTTLQEIESRFGSKVSDLVKECTDDKSLDIVTRKKLQITHAKQLTWAAKNIKLADKISNLLDLGKDPPKTWSSDRIHGYYLWCHEVYKSIVADGRVNELLELTIESIFSKRGILQMSPEDLRKGLEEYYLCIDKSHHHCDTTLDDAKAANVDTSI